MALKKDISLENGVKINDAYIKIVNLSGNKNDIFLDVGVYKDSSYTDDKYIDKTFYNFKPNVSDNADNFIKQGYDYLKTLEEFRYSADVLEEGQNL